MSIKELTTSSMRCVAHSVLMLSLPNDRKSLIILAVWKETCSAGISYLFDKYMVLTKQSTVLRK